MAGEVGVFTKEPRLERGGMSQRVRRLVGRARFVGLFSALLVLWSAGTVAQPSYHCRISGQVSKSCCCANKRDVRSETLIKPASCCDLIQAAQASNLTVLPDDTQEPVTAVAAAWVVLLADPYTSEKAHNLPVRLPWPRPPGPPRFIANCSLLI